MALTYRYIGVVGSRKFRNYLQLKRELEAVVGPEDIIVSGGAEGTDSMAQRWAKENGRAILIYYPLWRINGIYDAGAGFKRNKKIAEISDIILAFYQNGRFQQGGTANTAVWARKFDKDLREFEEEI